MFVCFLTLTSYFYIRLYSLDIMSNNCSGSKIINSEAVDLSECRSNEVSFVVTVNSMVASFV